MTHLPTTLEVIALFRANGDSLYGGESVSQLEHALQTASFAEQSAATDDLIVAALLHDIGHLLHDLPHDAPEHGIDDVHEMLGFEWLEDRFPESVSIPVRNHVAAKRYLCAVDASYFGRLSPASVVSLSLQGGRMSKEEQLQFETSPFFNESLQLRRWDDEAKVPGMATPSLEYYADHLDRVLQHSQMEQLRVE
jgi:phosphonate degradation associated HDIG domain protein